MSKFNEAIRKYITEQGIETSPITINPQVLSKTPLPKNNPELLKIAEILNTLENNIDPNSNIEDIISTITTLTPENKIKLEAKLKENGLSLKALDPQTQQTQTTTQNPNQQATPQQQSTPKASQSAYSSMPKA